MDNRALLWIVCGTMVPLMVLAETFQITRHNSGDIFAKVTQSGTERCTEETCIGLSSGTATAFSSRDLCTCRCHQHLPAFREDSSICVDDIHECALAPFISGSTSQQIPFVFLPLKEQIVYPSREIYFNGILKPICAVAGAKYLSENGWIDLRNPLDNDVPFRLFRDEGRTFLQWNGDLELRNKMSGRMVLVELMCRELDEDFTSQLKQKVFSPCVAFRIVGTPAKIPSNVTEVAFSLEAQSNSESSSSESLSVSEYIAIGVCSVLLGLIYVASVFLYLHLKKRNNIKEASATAPANVAHIEEGIVKSNPLLTLTHHFPDVAYSDTTNSSENEVTVPDSIRQKNQYHVTAAIVHTNQELHQDNGGFERLPEENVSIVETLDERPDSLKAITGRKKLYFNPAYFEPHLLMEPPAAALEFLAKIREVISVAKQKMAAKRYVPTLLNIPEEDTNYSVIEPSLEFSSRRGSIISLKRENSRRKSCSGCPGCEPQIIHPQIPLLGACQNCNLCIKSLRHTSVTVPVIGSGSESKQHSIRKWLEDIPVLRLDENLGPVALSPKRIRSPTRSLPTESVHSERTLSPRPSSEKSSNKRRKEKRIIKPTSPPPPIPQTRESFYDTVANEDRINLPPPDMIQEAIELEETTRIPTLTKRQMNAVINELTVHKHMLEAANRELAKRVSAGYDTDSLERHLRNKGFSTPSDYTELTSTQTSPSLTAALPIDEEITICNDVFQPNYEFLVLKDNQSYSLVSEVYVNNGYNFSSNPTSQSNSNCSTLEKNSLKIRYDGGAEKPGKLLIEVEDCMDHYIPVNDVDDFEPDTLDRPNKYEQKGQKILLRTTGSFKNDGLDVNSNNIDLGNFNRVFGSLREMYEEKRKLNLIQEDAGKLLTLEERHWKRQRVKTTSQGPVVPPDLIPPPPMLPKNYQGRSANNNKIGTPGNNFRISLYPEKEGRQKLRPEDSGYLSSDSNEKKHFQSEQNGSETDESAGGDAQSESGAESIETHSVFFGRFRRTASVEEASSSDSETVSYTTVVPMMTCNKTILSN
ncbi:hypothetical protein ABEB36_006410 [Hypothenemus hampei]|uniref:Shavenoid isoform B-like N-terminal domain-containing protein n=1 Tax=Hypothenemus hampei TaxID=57062 RepID=A0ABD1EQF8_HYPHA